MTLLALSDNRRFSVQSIVSVTRQTTISVFRKDHKLHEISLFGKEFDADISDSGAGYIRVKNHTDHRILLFTPKSAPEVKLSSSNEIKLHLLDSSLRFNFELLFEAQDTATPIQWLTTNNRVDRAPLTSQSQKTQLLALGTKTLKPTYMVQFIGPTLLGAADSLSTAKQILDQAYTDPEQSRLQLLQRIGRLYQKFYPCNSFEFVLDYVAKTCDFDLDFIDTLSAKELIGLCQPKKSVKSLRI